MHSVSPFPDNVPTAQIATVDFCKLAGDDKTAAQTVIDAARGYGFFYLTNHHVDSDFMFELADRVFALPTEEKMKYHMGSTGNYFGYKASGGHYMDVKGTPDRNEQYNISKDDILSVGCKGPLAHPQPIIERRQQLETFMRSCHKVVTVILRVLGKELGLPPELLPSLHRIEGTGGDQARLTYAPPAESGIITLGEHTDFGSVTVLFNQLGGLQVLTPNSKEWKYVKPKAGAAVINLGDAIVKLVGGRLYSGVHRVVGPPGEQAQHNRHSVVYFARPNGHIVLKSLMGGDADEQGETVTVDEWIARRARTRNIKNFQGEESFYANRGTEHNSETYKHIFDKHARQVEAV